MLGAFGAAGRPALVGDMVAFGETIRADNPALCVSLVAHSMGSFAAQELLLGRLTAFNAAFEHRTGYEWLTRDETEVDADVDDPSSGFDPADDTVPQLFCAAAPLADPEALTADVIAWLATRNG